MRWSQPAISIVTMWSRQKAKKRKIRSGGVTSGSLHNNQDSSFCDKECLTTGIVKPIVRVTRNIVPSYHLRETISQYTIPIPLRYVEPKCNVSATKGIIEPKCSAANACISGMLSKQA